MSPDVVRCVLLADRHHGLRQGVYGLLKTAFEAVVMVADEASLLESARQLQPVVTVVDLSLTPGLTSSPFLTSSPLLTPLCRAARSKPKDAAIRSVKPRSLVSER
jgi:DNA-binding NarL/FixJ family response regulator